MCQSAIESRERNDALKRGRIQEGLQEAVEGLKLAINTWLETGPVKCVCGEVLPTMRDLFQHHGGCDKHGKIFRDGLRRQDNDSKTK